MIIHRKLSTMKNKTFPTYPQGKYGDSLGEFSSTSYMHGIVGAERVNEFRVIIIKSG